MNLLARHFTHAAYSHFGHLIDEDKKNETTTLLSETPECDWSKDRTDDDMGAKAKDISPPGIFFGVTGSSYTKDMIPIHFFGGARAEEAEDLPQSSSGEVLLECRWSGDLSRERARAR